MGIFGISGPSQSQLPQPSPIIQELIDAVHGIESAFKDGDYHNPQPDFLNFLNALSTFKQLYDPNKNIFTKDEQTTVFDPFLTLFTIMAAGSTFHFAQSQMYYANHTYPSFNQEIDDAFTNVLNVLNNYSS
ncbi:MAG: hypothetical protein HY860_04610 [Chlamydiales bacterium]|nr:hypothetical protein [Chlamydiales bacterium]